MNQDASGTASPPAPSSVRTALLDAARTELIEHGAGGISLRAIARRAGVSHAAPKHHFDDRAGLLTAVATDGFTQFTAALSAAETGLADTEPAQRISALGRAYLDFGLAHPALFELMFRSEELNRADPELAAAQQASFSVFTGAVEHATGAGADHVADALVGWAFIHGLVVLVRDGALRLVGAATPEDSVRVARRLTDVFSAMLRAPR